MIMESIFSRMNVGPRLHESLLLFPVHRSHCSWRCGCSSARCKRIRTITIVTQAILCAFFFIPREVWVCRNPTELHANKHTQERRGAVVFGRVRHHRYDGEGSNPNVSAFDQHLVLVQEFDLQWHVTFACGRLAKQTKKNSTKLRNISLLLPLVSALALNSNFANVNDLDPGGTVWRPSKQH